MQRRIMSLREFKLNEMEELSLPIEIDDSFLDELVELVGSEEEVESAAEEAYEDLSAAAESGEVEISEDEVPENLVIAALVVKLVEQGKLGPAEADDLIEKYLG
jgi:hypothetical protein